MDKYFHGQKIAVTTITTMQKQNEFLQKGNFNFTSYDYSLDYFVKLFNSDKVLAKECFLETKNKSKIVKNKRQILEINKLQSILRKTAINIDDLLHIYQNFELFKDYSDLNINKDAYLEAVENAHLIRNRFTIFSRKCKLPLTVSKSISTNISRYENKWS